MKKGLFHALTAAAYPFGACVLSVSLTGSKAQYGECLTSVVVNAFAIVLTTLLCQLI